MNSLEFGLPADALHILARVEGMPVFAYIFRTQVRSLQPVPLQCQDPQHMGTPGCISTRPKNPLHTWSAFEAVAKDRFAQVSRRSYCSKVGR